MALAEATLCIPGDNLSVMRLRELLVSSVKATSAQRKAHLNLELEH